MYFVHSPYDLVAGIVDHRSYVILANVALTDATLNILDGNG